MSPIGPLMIQRRAQESGRIRIGVQVMGANGKARPSKLEAFRFTTASVRVAEAVAAAYGGTARRWEGAPVGEQWEVMTTATELSVAVPPGDAAVSQHMEMWSGGGCARRCDGETEQISGGGCLCPSDAQERIAAAASGRACKPTTRVSLILPDLPGIGVFRLETHGFYAATELGGAAELLAGARAAGVIVPAVLRLEQREVRSGGQTKRFPVPVLEIIPTLRELTTMSAGAGQLAASLPPPSSLALGAAAAPQAQQRVADAPGAPQSAQEAATRAHGATDRATLVDLGKVAASRSWLEDHVSLDDGATFEVLRDYLLARIAEVDRATGGAS